MPVQEFFVGAPGQGLAAGPAVQPLAPEPADRPVELVQAAVVRRSAVVLVVAPELAIENLTLISHRIMPMGLAPLGDALQAPSPAFAHRPHVDGELPLSTPSTKVREPQEVEGRRLPFASPFRVLRRMASELDQARLLRVQAQPVLLKPLLQDSLDALRVLLILKSRE